MNLERVKTQLAEVQITMPKNNLRVLKTNNKINICPRLYVVMNVRNKVNEGQIQLENINRTLQSAR